MRLRDCMAACRHINILLSYPGCKQLDDDNLFDTIITKGDHNTVLIIFGMDEMLMKDVKYKILNTLDRMVSSVYDNAIVSHTGLRIKFVNVNRSEAIYGLQPDYVYII